MNLLLQTGFIPVAAAVYQRAVSVALHSETLDAGRNETFELATCAAKALEALASAVVQHSPGPDDAFQTTLVRLR